jgi:hypothetical protein
VNFPNWEGAASPRRWASGDCAGAVVATIYVLWIGARLRSPAMPRAVAVLSNLIFATFGVGAVLPDWH